MVINELSPPHDATELLPELNVVLTVLFAQLRKEHH